MERSWTLWIYESQSAHQLYIETKLPGLIDSPGVVNLSPERQCKLVANVEEQLPEKERRACAEALIHGCRCR